MSTKLGWDSFVHSQPREDFDVLTAGEMSRLTSSELRDYTEARQIWNRNMPTVITPQLSAAFQMLRDAAASLQRDSNKPPGSVVIDALPGVGKTTIATEFGRVFHLERERATGQSTPAGHQHLPVAFVPMNAGMTLKGLNVKILEFYDHPAATRTRSELSSLVADTAFSCETQLIILDDLHFVDFGQRNGIEVSNHLKGLTREIPAVFVMVGVGLREKGFFEEGFAGPEAAYSQTSRRSTRCPVGPFTLGSANGYRAWVDLLTHFENHVKLADGRPGMLVDHAEYVHERTTGRLISLSQLVDEVCNLAIRSGGETITRELISAAKVDNAAELNESNRPGKLGGTRKNPL